MSYNKRLTELVLKGNPIIGLASAILGLFMGFASVAFFGATAPVIKEGMGLSPYQVGLLVAIPTLTGGLLRVPCGAWADSNGGKKPIVLLLLLTLCGLASFSVLALFYPEGEIPGNLYPVLLLCGALTGCGIGVFTAGIAHVSYWYSMARQGTALGLYSGIGGISSGVATALIPIGLYFIGFSGVYTLWFLIVLAGTVVFVITDRDAWYFQLLRAGVNPAKAAEKAKSAGQEEFPKGRMKESILTAAKNGRCWALTAVYFSTFGGSLALTAWLPSFWTAHHGFSLQAAGIITGLSSAFSPFMRIFGGKLSDIFQAEHITIAALSCCLAGGMILSFGGTAFMSGLGIFIMVGGIGISNASVFRLVPVYIDGAVGGAAGIIGGVGAMGGFIIPPLLGMAVSALGEGGYTKGFLIYSFLFAVCILIMTILDRKRVKNMTAAS